MSDEHRRKARGGRPQGSDPSHRGVPVGESGMTAPSSRPAFRPAAVKALKDSQLRGNFRRAMDGLISKRAAAFADPEEWRQMRSLGTSIRARTLANLPRLLETLEASCQRNRIHVHWAETAEEGNQIVFQILESQGVKRVIKGKSM